MRQYTRVYARIDLDAVKRNMSSMRAALEDDVKIMGVVKTDGYGHGAVPVAQAIEPYVSGYAVATIEEARNLQRHGTEKPILILGVTHPDDYGRLIKNGIRPSVFTMEQAQLLSSAAVGMGKTAMIHLAVDTGMNRIGMSCGPEGAELAAAIGELPGIFVEGIFTHLSRADESDKTSARRQMKRYADFLEMARARGLTVPVRHISNSAGILDMPGTHYDMVRAGISIYGMYPSDEVDKSRVPLWPAMSLLSRVTYVKEIGTGEEISYGGTFVTDRVTKVATVPVGYGDGYPRNLSGKGYVLIHGKRAPILGRICMDQFMVDVTDIPGVREEDEVTLIGRDGNECILVEDLARLCGGFHYEIVCDIGKRVPRVYVCDGNVIGTKDYFDDPYEDFA